MQALAISLLSLIVVIIYVLYKKNFFLTFWSKFMRTDKLAKDLTNYISLIKTCCSKFFFTRAFEILSINLAMGS